MKEANDVENKVAQHECQWFNMVIVYEPVMQVSKPGYVKVEKLMNIEQYSHAMHKNSTVTGKLLNYLTNWDVLRAALPIGTISRAPKAGAGIVADSDPADEQGECENEVVALARAIDLAESSFVEK
nr:anthranilate synthase alpha subunit 1, chloroplastic-like [Quercus suber]